MRYSKPQILTITKATVAIQNPNKDGSSTDSGLTTNPGYEDNE